MRTFLADRIDELIEREGGEQYTDHPSDRGGPTRWGVTEQVARAFGYKGDMRELPREVAVQIYAERYWFQPRFNEVDGLSAKIAEEMFDTGVNMGQGVAGRFLQRALNTLNRRAKDYPDIVVDGAIGRVTLYALSRYLARNGSKGELALWRMLNAQQSVRYMEISERDERQEDFQNGWQAHRVQGAPA